MDEISRVTRTHAQARASYDRLSRWYDLIEGGWETPPRRLGVELLRVQPGEPFLEIGCGTGSSFAMLPEAACVNAMDLSFKMIQQAQARLNKVNRPVGLAQGDALNLPFAPHSFNAVFMAFTLELMDTPEIPLVLREIRRVLNGGGRLGIVALSRLGGSRLMTGLYEWSHQHFPAVVDCRPILARTSLDEAGFAVVESHTVRLSGLGVEIVICSPR